MSSASHKKGRNSDKAAKSNKKVAASGKVEKYASKFVQPIVDDLGKTVLNESAKNQVAKDWVRKMTKSVLKKISEGSQTLYSTSDHNADEIQEKIDQLQKTIESQFTRLKENPNARARISLQPVAPEERAYSSGLYEAQFQSIQDKVQRLSDEINSARSAVDNRLGTMEETVASVRNNVDLFMKYAPQANTAPPTAQQVVSNTPTPSVISNSTATTARSQIPQQQQQLASQTQSSNNSQSTSATSASNSNNAGRKRSQAPANSKQEQLLKLRDHLG